MSFPLMQHVFYKSQFHGNAKVLLLALADDANDCCGLAWPAVETLAVKVGVNLRNTHKLLHQVSPGSAAELEILPRQGPKHVNLYRLRGVSLETGCRNRQGVVRHEKGCPWRQGGDVSGDRGKVSPATDNLSVYLSSHLSTPQADGDQSKRLTCGHHSCAQPQCPHSQFCAYHACCDVCTWKERS